LALKFLANFAIVQ